DVISVCPQNLNTLVGTGRTANMQQRIHIMFPPDFFIIAVRKSKRNPGRTGSPEKPSAGPVLRKSIFFLYNPRHSWYSNNWLFVETVRNEHDSRERIIPCQGIKSRAAGRWKAPSPSAAPKMPPSRSSP